MYWQDRMAKSQQKLTSKSIAETEKQLIKYYNKAMKSVIDDFEQTYQKLLDTITDERQPTPADLYKLDKYWQLQGQLRQKLQSLGDKQAVLFSKNFEQQFKDIYNAIALSDTDNFFSSMDEQGAKQMINQVWCADGKSWSNRVWDNTDKLQQALNDNLINCVVSGKKTSQLKDILQEQFKVSYNRADSLVKTEMAHIQTQAAQQRYKDAGITEFEVWADEDERRCDVCGKLHEKRFSINARVPVPVHPRCRCCIIPVVEPNNQLVVKDNRKQLVPVKKQLLTLQNNSDNIISNEWKKGKFRDVKAEERHKKHLSEYGDITFEEYVQGAKKLLSSSIGNNIDGFENNAGATYRYDIIKNDFAVGKDGIIFTRFKPIDGKSYWEAIKNEELKQK